MVEYQDNAAKGSILNESGMEKGIQCGNDDDLALRSSWGISPSMGGVTYLMMTPLTSQKGLSSVAEQSGMEG